METEKYAFDTVKEAIRFTFIVFFALGAKYPAEAQLIWQLLQTILFGIKAPGQDLRSIEFSELVGRLTRK